MTNKYSVIALSSVLTVSIDQSCYCYPLPLVDLPEDIPCQFTKATVLLCLPKSTNRSTPLCLFLQPFCHIMVNFCTFLAAALVQVWEHTLLKVYSLVFPESQKIEVRILAKTPPLCFLAIQPGSTPIQHDTFPGRFARFLEEVERRLTQSIPPSLCWTDYMSVQMMWTQPLVL